MHCSFPVSTSQQCVASWNFRIGRTHEEKCIAPYSEIHVQQDVSPAAYIYVDRLCILGAVSKDMHLLARHLVKYVGMACPYIERTDRILVSQSNWTRQASHLFASHY